MSGSSRRKGLLGVVVATVLAQGSGVAHATTELPAAYDARSVGLGGTGVSFMHNAAAAALNPGALQGVDKFAVNLMVEPGVLWQQAPLGPNTEIDAEPSFVPFFFGGAAFRVADRVVIGLAVLPTLGFATDYKNVPQLGGADLSFGLRSMEGTAAVSVRLLDNLSLGAGYRVTYSAVNVTQPVMQPGAPPMTAEAELSGWNALGARVGLHYQPIEALQLGLAYTSKIKTDLSGDTTMSGPLVPAMSVDSEQELAAPHILRLGASLELLDHKLLLALDGKALLYADSNKEQKTIIHTPAGDQVQVVPQDWKNVFGMGLGVEYRLVELLRLRLGYSLSTSAVPEKNAGIVGLPPGLLNAVHGGLGVTALPSLDIDLGAYYMKCGTEIGGSAPNAGQYDVDMIAAALSATYHR